MNTTICPRCACQHTSVTNTYTNTVKWKGKILTHVRRRRACRACGKTWFTSEMPEDPTGESTPPPPDVGHPTNDAPPKPKKGRKKKAEQSLPTQSPIIPVTELPNPFIE